MNLVDISYKICKILNPGLHNKMKQVYVEDNFLCRTIA